MNIENSNNETNLRHFLLGETADGEREKLEASFISDAEVFERMKVVEDELVESYVRGTLAPDDREKFEREFLTTAKRRERVAFTRAMFDKLAEQKSLAVENAAAEKPSVWQSIAGFFQMPKLAFGAAFALLTLLFGGWFLLRNQLETEIVRQITPTPTLETIQNNSNQTSPNENVWINANAAPKTDDNRNAPNANKPVLKNVEKPKEPVAAGNPVLALFTGTVRSEGKMKTLNLPKNAQTVGLQLNLETQDYKIYRVEIIDADGNLLVQNNNLRARNSKVNLSIPAVKLQRGDYIVKLSALTPQGADESVADYTFRVNRK